MFAWNGVRFVRFFRKEIREERKDMLSGIWGAFVAGALLSLFVASMGPEDYRHAGQVQGRMFVIVFIWMFVILVASSGKKTGYRERKVNYLMFPASLPEKYLSSFVRSLFLVPLSVGVALLSGGYAGLCIGGLCWSTPGEMFRPEFFLVRGLRAYWQELLFLHAWTFLGCYLWPWKSFGRVVWGLSAVLAVSALYFMYEASVPWESLLNKVRIGLTFLVPFLWACAFVRLKRMQILN